jgi:hypothetical protein
VEEVPAAPDADANAFAISLHAWPVSTLRTPCSSL